MGVSQTNQSFQNDGNFSLLDVRDEVFDGPVMRIETFRCSQPEGENGITAIGSSVTSITGLDHLTATSNRTFRHIFSTGPHENPKATLEIREIYSEDGSMEVRTRDIDGDSPSFGTVLIATILPRSQSVHIRYEVYRPHSVSATIIHSPIVAAISQQNTGLTDLSADINDLGFPVPIGKYEIINESLFINSDNENDFRRIDDFANALRTTYPQWTKNVEIYERMGDFRDKCIHPGKNLIGDNPALASEFMLIRAYRMSLIALGRVFDAQMSAGANHLNRDNALSLDTKPGVYSIFLSAYALNIGIYQLGLDKVHSDYGGVPMKLAPGSRLENGAQPITDATNLNRMLALVASLYYAPEALSPLISTRPSIADFDTYIPKAAESFQ